MNQRFLNRLIRFARPLSYELDGRFRHVSLVTYKKEIMSIGVNSNKTHPKAKEAGYRYECLHSEMDAFLKLPDRNIKGLELVNFRFNKRGELRNSCPCKYCMGWCLPFFKEIWYSTSEEEMEKYEL